MMLRRIGITVAATLLAACATEPVAPAPERAPVAEPQPPPPPAHLEPPNTAPVPHAGVASPQALDSQPPTRMALHRPALDYLEGPQIEKTFDHHKRYFSRLYQERLRERPGLVGVMRVNFMINADGTASNAVLVESDLHDAELEQAVLNQITQMTFPAARLATPVEGYPIVFSTPPKAQDK
jgi:outer membrane biosynthesis protein TonB